MPSSFTVASHLKPARTRADPACRGSSRARLPPRPRRASPPPAPTSASTCWSVRSSPACASTSRLESRTASGALFRIASIDRRGRPIERVVRTDLVDQTDPPGFVGIEALAGDAVATQVAHADRRAQLRDDRRRDHAPAHLGQREARGFGRDRHVARRRPCRPRRRSRRRGPERASVAGRRSERASPAVVRRENATLSSSAKPATSRSQARSAPAWKCLPLARRTSSRTRGSRGERRDRRAQRVDQGAIVGVVNLGPVQRDRRHAPLVDRGQHDARGHGGALLAGRRRLLL